ncbi:platelet basic protein [Manis pentadactyla]|uniref:platelet basic protein n=1 Tax=Manis pentadactyla TaxID=143292 RepID=UPI0018755393|nr:platelet basic protein [Manis pentadactyla]KAI5278833.1 Platelet Basic Protein [Manis pentadactyla]
MSPRPSSTSSCTSASPLRVLQVLLLSLLLTPLASSTVGEWERNLEEAEALSPGNERYTELRCMCVNTISGIHPSNIQNLEVIRAGPHCAQVEVIATLKNEKKICLDPEAPKIKKIIQKILESGGSAA